MAKLDVTKVHTTYHAGMWLWDLLHGKRPQRPLARKSSSPEDLRRMSEEEFARLLESLDSVDSEVAHSADAAICSLCYIRGPTVLIGARDITGWSSDQRRHVAGSVAIRPLLNSLENGGPRARILAGKLLATAGESSAIPLLIEALAANEPGVRSVSAASVAQFDDPAAIEPLITAMDDSDQSVRAAAASALGSLRAAAAVPDLLRLMWSRDWRDRASALHGLGSVIDADRVEVVRAALADPNRRVRKAAKSALSRYELRRRSASRNA